MLKLTNRLLNNLASANRLYCGMTLQADELIVPIAPSAPTAWYDIDGRATFNFCETKFPATINKWITDPKKIRFLSQLTLAIKEGIPYKVFLNNKFRIEIPETWATPRRVMNSVAYPSVDDARIDLYWLLILAGETSANANNIAINAI